MRPKGRGVWNPAFVLVVAISFTSYLSFHGLNSGTTVYLSLVGGSTAFAGVLAALYSVAAGVARMALGPVIDRRGRAAVMSVGAASFFLGAVLAGLSQGGLALVAGRALQGVGFGAITTAAATAAADVLPESRMGEGLGYYGLGNALSLSVGPALALFLVAADPPETLFFALAGLSVVVFVLTLFCRYERHPARLPETASYRERLRAGAEGKGREACPERGVRRFFESRALCGALPMMFMSAANGFSVFFAGLYGTSLGLANAGLYFTLSAASMVVVRLKSKAYMDRVLPIKVFTVAVGTGLAGLALLLAAPALPWLFYVAGLLYGFSLGITLPLNQSVAVKNTPVERWGAGNALFLLASDVGVACTCVLWGVVNDAFGFWAAIVGAMACMAVAYALAWAVYPPWAKRPAG